MCYSKSRRRERLPIEVDETGSGVARAEARHYETWNRNSVCERAYVPHRVRTWCQRRNNLEVLARRSVVRRWECAACTYSRVTYITDSCVNLVFARIYSSAFEPRSYCVLNGGKCVGITYGSVLRILRAYVSRISNLAEISNWFWFVENLMRVYRDIWASRARVKFRNV